MKKIAVICLTLLVVMLNACDVSGSDLYTNNSVSNPTQSSLKKPEKLALGVKYALNNLPADIYDYVPKDSLDMYMPLLMSMTDSVYFTKRGVEEDRSKATKALDEKNASVGGGSFSTIVGGYKYETSAFTIGFFIGLSVSYTEPIEGLYNYSSSYLYIAQKTSSIQISDGFKIENENIRITDIYLDPSVGGPYGGMACRFLVRGEVHGTLSVGIITIHSGCLVDFESEGCACEYPQGSKYTSTFTPHL